MRLKSQGKCIPKSLQTPWYELTSSKIDENIQYLSDHDVIGKFMGIWPKMKALI